MSSSTSSISSVTTGGGTTHYDSVSSMTSGAGPSTGGRGGGGGGGGGDDDDDGGPRIPRIKPQNVFAVSAKYAQYANTARQYLNSFAVPDAEDGDGKSGWEGGGEEEGGGGGLDGGEGGLDGGEGGLDGGEGDGESDESDSISIDISLSSSDDDDADDDGDGSGLGYGLGGDGKGTTLMSSSSSSSSLGPGLVEVPSPDEHEWVKDFARIAWGETWQDDNVYPEMLETNDVERFKEGVDAVWHNSRLNEPLESMLRHCYTNAGIISLRQCLVQTQLVSNAFIQDLHVQLSTVSASVENLESFLVTSATTLEVIRVAVNEIKDFAYTQASARLPSLIADAIESTSLSLTTDSARVLRLVDQELSAGRGISSGLSSLEPKVVRAKFEEVFVASSSNVPSNIRFATQEQATEFVDFMTHVFKVASSEIQDALISKLLSGARTLISEIESKVREVLEPHLLSYQNDVQKVLELFIVFPDLEAPELSSFANDIQANTLRTLDKPSTRKWAVFWLLKYIPVPSLRKSSAYEVSGRVIKDAFEAGLQRVADATMDSAESMSSLFRTKVEEYGSSVERELYRLMYRIKQTVDNKRSAHDHSVIVQQGCEELLWKYHAMDAARSDLLSELEKRLLVTGAFSALDVSGNSSSSVPSSSVLSPKSFEPSEAVLAVRVFQAIPIGVPVARATGAGTSAAAAAAAGPSAGVEEEDEVGAGTSFVLSNDGDVRITLGHQAGSSVLGLVFEGKKGEAEEASVMVRDAVVSAGPDTGRVAARAATLVSVSHPSLAIPVGYADCVPGHVFYVTETVVGSALDAILRRGEGIGDIEERVGVLQDVVAGLSELHANNLVHGNLGSGNIVLRLSKRGKVKRAVLTNPILDLDVSEDQVGKQVLRGNYVYYPPEVLSAWKESSLTSEVWTLEADIYAFGCVVYEIMTQVSLVDHASLFSPHDVIQGTRPLVPPELDRECPAIVTLLDACWSTDPRQRPTCVELVKYLKTMQFTAAFQRVF